MEEVKKASCGVRPTISWLSPVLAILIVAGAVGGGVGGRVAADDNIRE